MRDVQAPLGPQNANTILQLKRVSERQEVKVNME